ncbi:MAG TPA: 2-phosphosulfolactate phosphatase [Pirellulales bacterium]|jgi:2-phosphosulfolactate phosphatase|nr:2-phosphosulfolactate phosphatase [Pirellulales bacterium]
MPDLRVHFLPELIAPDDLVGSTCVVIDVLRATTTTIYALAAGARAVIPCLTIDDAWQSAAAFPAGQAILGGERGGVKIEGFDLGNSPAEYSPTTVNGKTVVLTTTNGTKALLHCRMAGEILIAGFVNLSAVCHVLAQTSDSNPLSPRGRGQREGERLRSTRNSSVNLICAGTDGEITREDVLLAGAIVARLLENGSWHLNDQAAVARDAWLRIMASAASADVQPRLLEALRSSQGGRNLIALGMDRDIELAANVDRFAITPRYHAATGRIKTERPDAPPTP